MSARLSMNQIPIIQWKGQTFNQVVSHIKKNGAIHNNSIDNNIFSALPLKTYRREIAGEDCTSSRNTTTIDILNRPGSSIVNSFSTSCKGLVNIVDFNLTTNSSEIPGNCNAECVVGTEETKAKRRVRSSGMIKKQYDLSTDKPTYYTDSRQYLNSRNKTYEQNNFHYFREGDQNAVQGSPQASENIYTTNSTTDCKRAYISSDTSFTYQWVAGNPTFAETGSQPTDENGAIIDEVAGQYGNFTVNIKKGFYDIPDINRVLHAQMILNEHYFVDNNQAKHFFIKFVFNTNTRLVELQIDPISQNTIDTLGLNQPTIETNIGTRPPVWNVPESAQIPIIEILDNSFKSIIGFNIGSYPSANTTSNFVVASTNSPLIKPRYNRVYYKPNNHQYAQQGAVSSSSRITRLKYNAITNVASSYRNAFGLHVANALAYGVPANGYTVKDKIGYPLPKTPRFTSTGEQRDCVNVSISG
tara:strand:+ start:463 stop:1875 length:1413 start_codon:yes stop_codon:yes gene_type:complete